MAQIRHANRIATAAFLMGGLLFGHLAPVLAQALPAPIPPPPPIHKQVRVDFSANDMQLAFRKSAFETDPVRIASVSKLVVALGVMRMVEAGQLNLDADVSTYLGYRVRNPAFPVEKITLRRLLSHQSGLMDAGELYLIPIGDTVRARLENTAMWDKDHAPGGYFRYANINFPVVASVMEKVSGERFDRLMQRLVLTPLQTGGCFGWASCTDDEVARAVPLFGAAGNVRADNLLGKRPECPVYRTAGTPCDLTSYVPGTNGALFSPQGGLRISMNGLAMIGQMMLRKGVGSDGKRFLKAVSLAEITRPQWQLKRVKGKVNGLDEGDAEGGFFCTYGLAVQTLRAKAQRKNPDCKDGVFPDGRARFGHAGDAYGLKSGLWIDPKSGRGVAFFATAVVDGEKGQYSAFTATEETMLKKPVSAYLK
jgi:CubicO group peptidase (beta-lactamase class C family)